MNIGKLSYFARKIHRFMVVLITVTGGIMMMTGITMKYPGLLPIDPLQARLVHNIVSVFFVGVFATMMLTGLLMYTAPWILKSIRKPVGPPDRIA